jgi:predicted amidohydrolase
MRVAAAQISCVLGDRAANIGKVREFASRAKRSGAELIVFPEMIDTGYSMPTIKQYAAAWEERAAPELKRSRESSVFDVIESVRSRMAAFTHRRPDLY